MEDAIKGDNYHQVMPYFLNLLYKDQIWMLYILIVLGRVNKTFSTLLSISLLLNLPYKLNPNKNIIVKPPPFPQSNHTIKPINVLKL